MEKLLRGIARFQNDVYPKSQELFEQLATRQEPETLYIGCSDSRVVPHLLLQTQPGDLFICRNAGNIVPPWGDVVGGVSATVEYGVQVLGVKHIVICGHSDCGAMRAALQPERVQHFRAVSAWLHHAERVLAVVRETHPNLSEEAFLEVVIEENVDAQIHNLLTHPSVAARVRAGTLQVHGMVYDIARGSVKVQDRETGRFENVQRILERLEPAGGPTPDGGR
ncbi:MAG: carbonic anhydrase [Vicinamibacterales bacterium]